MAPGSFRFDRFRLDPLDRRLTRDGAPVELNTRYLDALALLASEPGKLVSKDRFLAEVWRGVPVTDEALTQCIKTLRNRLGDDAANPRFIETVPKHGYRFIAPVEWVEHEAVISVVASRAGPAVTKVEPWRRVVALGGAGMVGGGIASVFGGLFYGFGGASGALSSGMGATSIVLVLVCLTALLAVAGGAGVGFGIAASDVARQRRWLWSLIGGAVGGMVTGALVELLGLDAFNLLFGQSPGDITGAIEGALLGGAVGLGVWLGPRLAGARSLWRTMVVAGAVGCGGGVLIALSGGRLMGGSLDVLARRFPDSRLRLDQMGGLFGESGFGPITQMVTSGLEGALFTACIAGAMCLMRRHLDHDRPGPVL